MMKWGKGLLGFTGLWIRANIQRIAEGRAAPLLATPTHAGGWIDPRVFVERYQTWYSLPSRCPPRISSWPCFACP